MRQKKFYISPVTAVLTDSSSSPLMMEMTLYTGSPYVTLTTVEYGSQGFTSSEGSW